MNQGSSLHLRLHRHPGRADSEAVLVMIGCWRTLSTD